LLEYDNVANDQRKVIYDQRDKLMDAGDISQDITTIRREVLNNAISAFIPPQSLEEQWQTTELEQTLEHEFGVQVPIAEWLKNDEKLNEQGLRDRVIKEFEDAHASKTGEFGDSNMRDAEKFVMLQVIDREWKEHLAAMDYLRQGIHLRGYAQKNPKDEFKREAFMLFSEMLERIKYEVVRILPRLQIHTETDMDALAMHGGPQENMEFMHPDASQDMSSAEDGEHAVENKPVVRQGRKIGRNEPCPCGSGKKYKQCHGKLS